MAAFKLNLADLEFVLRQIKIAEANSTAHADGAVELRQVYVDAEGNTVDTSGTPYSPASHPNLSLTLAIPDPHVPAGLRTVDGSYNSLVAGREQWGASGQPMPRLLDSNYIDEADGDAMPFGAPGAPVVTNNDYGVINGTPTNPNAPGGNGGNTGNVADADPRTISNLIVDMSMNNPAAILAALTFAGSEDPMADLAAIMALNLSPAAAAAALGAASTALEVANVALNAAVVAYSGTSDPLLRPGLIDAIQEAAEDVTAAETALAQAASVAANPKAAMIALAEEKGLTFNNGSLDIPNIAPDEGLSAPFNAWMTFFGQFFDHGLDLISKGGNGTIYIPLAADDPLVTHGPDGIAGNGDETGPNNSFMVLTRSSTVPGDGGEPTQRNVTTPFVDQNQTYTSHASHQVFLREYGLVDGRPVATGKLLGGVDGGLATWADVKTQARTMLGIDLVDSDVFAVPQLMTDAYGEFIRDPVTGMPQILAGVSLAGVPIYVSGTPGAPIMPSAIQLPVGIQLMGGNTITAGETVSAARTFNAFLDDIAHNAVPTPFVDHDRNPATAPIAVQPDEDTIAGNAITPNEFGVNITYDNELLERHFITGDGRGNENIGLSAVHHVFHSEHNRQVDAQKLTILENGDLAFVREWLANGNALSEMELAAIKSGLESAANKLTYLASLEDSPDLATGVTEVQLSWDGERLFQAARFATEMQYQHLVFEEFGRKIQPNIDVFVFNSVTDVDPRIFGEFANVIYRFGHSMLTENMPRIGANGQVMDGGDLTLIESFLHPVLFDEHQILVDHDNDPNTQNLPQTIHISHDEGAAAIVRGMTIERGNEIDEFITGALRNNLLGLPLDLAAINIARGRDTGMPTLNEARQQLFDASGSSFLTPYSSWTEFAANLKNPMSVVNFIAAYGQHVSIIGRVAAPTPANPDATREKTLDEKRDAAMLLVFGGANEPTDRLAFLNSTGAWSAATSGLNDIDLWIGGLAEKKMPFGGMLGSTFNAVFELQMENLQDGDRFYYLTRTQGQNFLTSLEQNSFAKMIMANTALAQPGADGIRGTADDIVERHIGVDSFATYDYVLEVNATKQADYNGAAAGVDPSGNDPTLEALGLSKVLRDDPGTAGADSNYIRFFGGEHVVLGGTAGNDTIIGDFGDDGIWGDMGDDRIEAGAGVDLVNGGAGDDIITDSGDTGDFLKGDEGDDVIANSNGLDILMGGSGKDVFFVGVDSTEVFAGEGDDFILGGDGADFLLGNEGDDWIEAGGGFDTTAGDNSELFFNSAIKGHDVMFAGNDEHDFDAESGDDIMVQGESVMRNEGMFGFDWAIFKGMRLNAYADMNIPIFTTEQADTLRNRFDKVEALSGWDNDDTLIGDSRVFGDIAPGATVGTTEGVFFNDGLSQAGIDRIDGLRALLGNLIRATNDPSYTPAQLEDPELQIAFDGGNILLGGGGNDLMQGNGGDDFLDGNSWLNVRIRITEAGQEDVASNEIATVDSLKHVFAAGEGPAAWNGKSLFELMISRVIVPNQLHIVREIIEDDGIGENGVVDTDIAVFSDVRANYSITSNQNGTITVTHNAVTVGAIDPLTGRNLVSDGVDTLRNIEQLRFSDQTVTLSPPQLKLDGFNLGGTYVDSFIAQNYGNSNGTLNWGPDWVESGDDNSATAAGGQIRIIGGQLQFDAGDGASISRQVNLAAAASARLTYSVNENGFDANETVLVEFSPNGLAPFTVLESINNNTNNVNRTFDLAGPFTSNAVIRFTVSNVVGNADFVNIANLAFTLSVPNPTPTVNYQTTFTENGAAVAIASGPSIVDDAALMTSARIVLTNASDGDQLQVGALPAGIAAVVNTVTAGQITVTLTGTASQLAYQNAIQAVSYLNTSEDPVGGNRLINITVNDGLVDSNVAVSTVNVVPVDDPIDANNDTIVTNIVPGTSFAVPKWALLANDVDPDNTPNVTAVSVQNGLTAVLSTASVTITDTDIADGSFVYTATGGPASNNATVTVDSVAAFTETFGTTSYTDGDSTWTQDWVETGDDNSSTGAAGQIRINNGQLQFDAGSTAVASNGASIQRGLAGLAGATSASISYSFSENIDPNETVTVAFSRDGFNIQTVQTITSTSGAGNITNLALTGPFTNGAFVRFTASAMNLDADVVNIDNLNIAFTAPSIAVNGDAGNQILVGDVNDSAFNGGAGNDIIFAGGGNDTITQNASDGGRDFVDGGTEASVAGDLYILNGTNAAEQFRVYAKADAVAAGIYDAAGLAEIVITRNTGGPVTAANVIAELTDIEEIVINTGPGADFVTTIGNFDPTGLNFNTITINGDGGNDTVDVSALQSAHRILFRSNGGNDTILGDLRPQDVIELAPGTDLAGYALADNGNGTQTLSNGTHSITFTGAVPPLFQNTPPPAGNGEGVSGAFEYTPSDLAGLKALVNGLVPATAEDDAVPTGPRALSGLGNNQANPAWGSADQPFIRITDAHYGAPDADGNRAINPIFDGLDPRQISNILGAQEAGLPKAGNDANIFFMTMGQYIDHGLDFLPKGGNGTIAIGGVGGPLSTNPADLTRGTVIGFDADGNPLHKNQTSPYVDQNQAYGSHNLVGQFLRESDGNQGSGMRLLAGAPDPSNPDFNLLPTLRELIRHHWSADTIFTDPSLPGDQISFRAYYTNYAIDAGTTGTLFNDEAGAFDPGVVSKLISNFMGSGHPLLLDANPFVNVLDHFVAGDGRANENFGLTAIHTIWARNHNYHVDGLLAAGFEGTAKEVFQAAKMINEAEYQRVVFDEYLDTLLGGLRSVGTHGFEEYDPNANAAISHEFAAAAFRFGHSLIGQKLTVLDADGNPVEVNLFDAFLNPSNAADVFSRPLPPGYVPQPGYAQYGVNAIIGGQVVQASEDVDFNIVDAVRNDLVRISADLFAFNVARGWDVGLGTLNQVRMDLAASTDPYVREAVGFAGGDLSAYTSWADFQTRNGLSNAVIAQFMQAYPDLVLAAADIAAFQAINPDIAIAMQQDGTGIVKGIDRVDFWVGGLAEKHINDGIVGQSFWVVLSEQFERLQDADRFYYIDRFDGFDFYQNFIDGQGFADIVARNTGMTNLPEHMFQTDDEDAAAGGDDPSTDDGDTVDDGDGVGAGGDGEDGGDGSTDGDDGDDGDDPVDDGEDGGVDPVDDDDVDGVGDDDGQGDNDDDGTDDGDDTGPTPVPVPPVVAGLVVAGTAAADVMVGGAAADVLSGGEGDDILLGGEAGDTLMGGSGSDLVKGDGGSDVIFGGSGGDVLFGGGGADLVLGDEGDDRLFGDEGDDVLEGGAGSDVVYGGSGDDRFIARQGDGDDIHWGESGADTLDYAAITAHLSIDLGNGSLQHGSVVSSQSGFDAIFGFENVIGGAGDDTIVASAAVNVIDGGGGNDSFVFRSAADADGDVIRGFAHGDRIDLSGMAGPAGFTLATASLTGAGQVLVTHVSGGDGEALTRIQGNVSGGDGADFTLDVAGHHNLTQSDFNGVS